MFDHSLRMFTDRGQSGGGQPRASCKILLATTSGPIRPEMAGT